VRNGLPDHFAIAADIISRSDRGRPADGVLRATLKAQRGLVRSDAREISRAVFTYYRWRGWLDAKEPLPGQVRQAMRVAGEFGREPRTLTGLELKKAVPDWALGEMNPAWLKSLQREPDLWLRARKGRGRALAAKLPAVPSQVLPDALRYEGEEDLFRTPEFQAGEFEIQDIASQAVGHLCLPQPGQTWWDACAGEGGKLLHLSDLMANRGLIWASDRAEWRLKKLKLRAARAGCFNYRSVVWDGQKLPTKTKFDGVLVDAPCSGVGTWGRNPHARWTTTPEDVAELAQEQAWLLGRTAAAVKPGGKLVYAVCTVTRAETTGVAEAFAAGHPEFEPLPVGDALGSLPGSKQSNLVSLQEPGGNGMFIAQWRRTG
jgi:16S rRNA (cytosine967-C5)-methyltransferase